VAFAPIETTGASALGGLDRLTVQDDHRRAGQAAAAQARVIALMSPASQGEGQLLKHPLILGYEDLNDHDHLRRDPVHGLICGKSDPLGQDRILERDKGKALAAHSARSTLKTWV
jgi:hypothetical protein